MTSLLKKILVNSNLGRFKKGEVVTIEVDQDGIPKDHFWRNRLNDAAIDNCVSIVEEKTDNKKQKGD
jgi:hypothetical protein